MKTRTPKRPPARHVGAITATAGTVTITNAAAEQVAKKLLEVADAKLHPVMSLRIVKLHRAITEHLRDVQTVRAKLVDAAAEKDKDGKNVPGEQPGTIKLDPANAEEFGAAMAVLDAETWSTDLTLKVAQFGDVPISPSFVGVLGALFVE